MHIRLGKAQRVTAIDDGGVSMALCRDSSSKESHRVVLSVEVCPILSPPADYSRRNAKSMQKKTMRLPQTATRHKSLPKCSDKYAIQNSLKTWTTNTRRLGRRPVTPP